MRAAVADMMELPIYGLAEAAEYLRVPLNTLRYWVHGGGSRPAIDQAGPALNLFACRSRICWSAPC